MKAQGRMLVVVLAGVAVLAGFWFVVLAPKRADTAAMSDQIAQAELRRDAAVTAAASAEQARRDYQRDYATVARLGKAVPGDDDVASLVYQLESVANDNKIDFRSVQLSGGGGAAAPAEPAATDPAATDTEKDATDTPVTPTPVVSQAPPGAVVGTAGLLTLPFTFTFDGGYLPTQRMLGAIDRLADVNDAGISVRGRLLTVDGFSLSQGLDGFPKVKAQVSATAYIVPADQGATGGATPAGPAGATTGPGATDTSASIQGIRP